MTVRHVHRSVQRAQMTRVSPDPFESFVGEMATEINKHRGVEGINQVSNFTHAAQTVLAKYHSKPLSAATMQKIQRHYDAEISRISLQGHVTHRLPDGDI